MRNILFVGLMVSFVNMSDGQSVVSTAQAQASQVTSTGTISVTFKNTPLRDAVRTIVQKSGADVAYSPQALPSGARVTYEGRGVNPLVALEAVTRNTGVRLVNGDGGRVKLVYDGARNGQGMITGKVTDGRTGKGLPSANVSLESENKAVITGEDGSYRLSGVSAGVTTVTVRMVGYAKQVRSLNIGDGATVVANFKLEPSANVLDQVVVTGTVVASELKSVPNAITIVSAKQIEERGITRIDQLFRGDTPGLFSMNLGSSAMFNEVSMFSRGATALPGGLSAGTSGAGGISNPIKTYVDGIEMADPKYLSQIDPRSIERIEIITGPQASTIYGANAINGVMQIFTKRGSSSRPRLSLDLTSGIAQNNFNDHLAPTHIANGSVSGMEGKISYNVGSSWNYIGAWSPANQTQVTGGYGGVRTDILSKVTADMSARRVLTRNRQNGYISQAENELLESGDFSPDAGTNIARSVLQLWSLNSRSVGFSFDYRPFSWWSHKIGFGSDASNTETILTAPTFRSISDTGVYINGGTTSRASQSYSTTLQVPVASLARVDLTLGGDHWRSISSSWSSSGNSTTGTLSSPTVVRLHPFKNTGGFAQGQLGIRDALFVTYGVRMDWNPNYGESVRVRPGRYGVSYARDIGSVSAKLRGSYGRSIRPPRDSLTLAVPNVNAARLQRFGVFDFRLGNPDLVPEHQQGGEGGIEMYFGSRGSLVVTRFNQTVDNLIFDVAGADSVRSLTAVSPSTTQCSPIQGTSIVAFDPDGYCYRYQFQFLNIGSIRNQGWELQGSMNMGPFTTRGTYSWTKSRILGITPRYRSKLQATNPNIQAGRTFDYIPEHTWAVGINYSNFSTTVDISMNGLGQRHIFQSDLDLALSSSQRLIAVKPRTEASLRSIGFVMLEKGYATSDLNASHRFSSRLDATLQVSNLGNYYRNDVDAGYASIGRQSRLGLRIRLN